VLALLITILSEQDITSPPHA